MLRNTSLPFPSYNHHPCTSPHYFAFHSWNNLLSCLFPLTILPFQFTPTLSLQKNFPEACSDYVSLLCSDLQCHCTPSPPQKSEHMNLTSTIHMALPQFNCNNSYNSLHTLNCWPNVSINCFLNIPSHFHFFHVLPFPVFSPRPISKI